MDGGGLALGLVRKYTRTGTDITTFVPSRKKVHFTSVAVTYLLNFPRAAQVDIRYAEERLFVVSCIFIPGVTVKQSDHTHDNNYFAR